MSLFEELIDYIEKIGGDINSMYVKKSSNNDQYDQLSYLDSDDNGNEYITTIFLDRDDKTVLVVTERSLNRFNEQSIVKFANELNKYYNDITFYANNSGNRFGAKKTEFIDGDLGRLIGCVIDVNSYAKEQSIKIET